MSDLWEYGGNTDDSETSSNSSDGAVGGADLASYIAPEKLKRMQTYFTATEGALSGPSGSRGLGRKRDLAEVVNGFEEEEEEDMKGWAGGFGAGGGDDELGSLPEYADVVDDEAAKAQHVLQNCFRGGHEEEEEEEDDYSDIEDDDAILYTGATSRGVQQGNGLGEEEDASIRSIRLHLIDADKHEFYVNAVVESTFEYPFSKFEEHAKQEGWLQDTQGVKYVLEGDPIDPAMNTPHDFDLEDGDIIEVYYYTR